MDENEDRSRRERAYAEPYYTDMSCWYTSLHRDDPIMKALVGGDPRWPSVIRVWRLAEDHIKRVVDLDVYTMGAPKPDEGNHCTGYGNRSGGPGLSLEIDLPLDKELKCREEDAPTIIRDGFMLDLQVWARRKFGLNGSELPDWLTVDVSIIVSRRIRAQDPAVDKFFSYPLR